MCDLCSLCLRTAHRRVQISAKLRHLSRVDVNANSAIFTVRVLGALMLEASKIARDFSDSKKIETGTVEVLEWIGAAYGRQRSGAQDAQSTTAEAPTSKHMAANARAALFLNYLKTTAPSLSAPSRQTFAAFVVLLGTVCGAAFQHMGGTEHLRTTIEPMTETYVDASQAVQHSEVQETTEKPALADIEHEVQEAKSRLADESQARISAETKAAQLATALAAETLARENAERAATLASVEIAAERKARTVAEEAANSAQEALARAPTNAAPDPSTLLPATPRASPTESSSTANSPPRQETEQSHNVLQIAATSSDKFGGALLEGQKHFAQGDLEGARQYFRRVVKMGFPEGALALGNTFDPVSLSKAGLLGVPRDPAQARQWYRLAHTLAQNRRQKRE